MAEAQAEALNDDQLCEFYFYSGERRSLRGDHAGGVGSLRKAAKLCPVHFVESASARWEVAKIGHAPIIN